MKSINTHHVPSGFKTYNTSDGRFAAHIGPYFIKNKFPKTIFGTRITEKQSNLNNVSHGGFLMAFADTVGGYYSYKTVRKPVVTVTLNSLFIRPVPVGSWVEALGNVKKSGKNMVFIDVDIFSKKKLVFSACGTWQIINIDKA